MNCCDSARRIGQPFHGSLIAQSRAAIRAVMERTIAALVDRQSNLSNFPPGVGALTRTSAVTERTLDNTYTSPGTIVFERPSLRGPFFPNAKMATLGAGNLLDRQHRLSCSLLSPEKDSLAEAAKVRRRSMAKMVSFGRKVALRKNVANRKHCSIAGLAAITMIFPKPAPSMRWVMSTSTRPKNWKAKLGADAFRAAAAKYKNAAANWRSRRAGTRCAADDGRELLLLRRLLQVRASLRQVGQRISTQPLHDHIGSRRFEIADYWLKEDGADHKPFYMVNFTNRHSHSMTPVGMANVCSRRCGWMIPPARIPTMPTMRYGSRQFSERRLRVGGRYVFRFRVTYPIASINSKPSSWNCKA